MPEPKYEELAARSACMPRPAAATNRSPLPQCQRVARQLPARVALPDLRFHDQAARWAQQCADDPSFALWPLDNRRRLAPPPPPPNGALTSTPSTVLLPCPQA